MAPQLLVAGAQRLLEVAVEALGGQQRQREGGRLVGQAGQLPAARTQPLQSLDDAGWTAEDLWSALGQTALQSTRKANEIWHEFERPLRRLLHRYHRPEDTERCAAHATARRFYGEWARNQGAGREQQVVLAECLWHEAARMAIEDAGAMAETLPDVAVALAKACGRGPMYQAAEYREAVFHRLDDDEELQLLLSSNEGLFGSIVESVTDVIGGDE